MDRLVLVTLLEELLQHGQVMETMINDAALILKEYDEEDDEAGEWIDRFIIHALQRNQFNDKIKKLVRALREEGPSNDRHLQ